MPTIKPFRAIRYDKAKVKDISAVVAPPYDIISGKLQDELYRKHANNFVKLELNKITPSDDEQFNRYSRAKNLFDVWLDNGVMKPDPKPAIYIYAQRYKVGAKAIEQIGYIALLGLELKGNKVLPHENTLALPKEDRLKLIRQINANLSPIFVLYEDKIHALTKIMKTFMSKNKAAIDIEYDGVRHRVWKVEDNSIIKKMERVMAPKDIFIADGHHRYEVSRMYFNEAKLRDLPKDIKEASGYMMVYFVEMDERMLTVLPAHRLVKDMNGLDEYWILQRLGKYFSISKVGSVKTLLEKMKKSAKSHVFGMYLGGKDYYLLHLDSEKDSDKAIKDKPLAWKRLDVSILHKFIIQHVLGARDDDDNIEFLKSAEETVKAMKAGKFEAAFFLNPTKVSEIKKIARIGERMPRKSTYFYPKQLSGLVVNKF